MTAMTAAEFGFQDPPADQPQWLALAQAVFNTQAPKIDDACGGGLRWQAYTYLSGYDYKNSISNGCFFNVGARLAMYTKNDTYAQYAEQIWDWMESVNFIDDQFNVYDGAGVPSNCTDRNPYQFSYNAGIFMFGAAVMYQYTEEQKWADRVTKIVDQTIKVFFPEQDGGILTEVACEYGLTCTIDMYAQKAFITRWMAATSKVAPFTYDTIMDALRKSAPAAVAQCSGGDTGRRCGLSWRLKDQWDGTQGVGQQMGVLEVVQSLLIKDARPPVANDTGGTSGGDPLAGTNPIRWEEDRIIIGTKDRAGAAIITILLGGGIAAMCAFMTFGK